MMRGKEPAQPSSRATITSRWASSPLSEGGGNNQRQTSACSLPTPSERDTIGANDLFIFHLEERVSPNCQSSTAVTLPARRDHLDDVPFEAPGSTSCLRNFCLLKNCTVHLGIPQDADRRMQSASPLVPDVAQCHSNGDPASTSSLTYLP